MKDDYLSEYANDPEFEQLGVRDCELLPDGMPRQWYGQPLRVSVGLILTGNNCISRGFFETFVVTSVYGAVGNIVKAEDLNLQYTFSSTITVPLCAYDADWPLLRRGRESRQCNPRGFVQGTEPWTSHWDRTLFEIYRRPFNSDPLSGTSRWGGRIYLRVGGRTPENAAADWGKCAKILRSIYRRVSSDAKHANGPGRPHLSR